MTPVYEGAYGVALQVSATLLGTCHQQGVPPYNGPAPKVQLCEFVQVNQFS